MRRPTVLLATSLAILVAIAAGVAAGGGFGSPAPTGAATASTPSSTAPTTPAASLTPTPTPTLTPSPTPIPTPTPTPTPVLVPAPLTGRLVSPEVAERHPIAVMIDDLRPARPQSGLGSAAVVWHAPAEGGIPRYMAIFQDTLPDELGPVRSARQYYIGWAAEWRAVYVHSGGSPQALATLRSKGSGQYVYNADEFRWGSRFFDRISERYAPHNVYTDGKRLRKLARTLKAKDGPIEAAWRFGPDEIMSDRPFGGRIRVTYPANTVTYRYSRNSNTYPRAVTGEKRQVDAATDERIAPKNVVIMVVRFGPLNDGSSKNRLEADFIGSGRAWIATNGRTIKGTWRKEAMKGPTRFFDAAGAEVVLTMGQTFIQVVPRSSTVSIEDGTDEPPPPPSASPSASASASPAAP